MINRILICSCTFLQSQNYNYLWFVQQEQLGLSHYSAPSTSWRRKEARHAGTKIRTRVKLFRESSYLNILKFSWGPSWVMWRFFINRDQLEPPVSDLMFFHHRARSVWAPHEWRNNAFVAKIANTCLTNFFMAILRWPKGCQLLPPCMIVRQIWCRQVTPEKDSRVARETKLLLV